MKTLLLCIIWLLSTAGASAQALWQDVPVGATRAEVQARVPEAQAAPVGAQPGNEDVQLEIAAHELLGARFKVSFVFKADQLHHITLLANTGSAQEARALGQRLTQAQALALDLATQASHRAEVVHMQVQALDDTEAARAFDTHTHTLSLPLELPQ